MDMWKLVKDPLKGGYSEGFDPKREYEFKRKDEGVGLFRLVDTHPMFNIYGLYYRDLPR